MVLKNVLSFACSYTSLNEVFRVRNLTISLFFSLNFLNCKNWKCLDTCNRKSKWWWFDQTRVSFCHVKKSRVEGVFGVYLSAQRCQFRCLLSFLHFSLMILTWQPPILSSVPGAYWPILSNVLAIIQLLREKSSNVKDKNDLSLFWHVFLFISFWVALGLNEITLSLI